MPHKEHFGFDTTYPKTVTNKAWKKKKSLKDKASKATKTGLGEALEKAEVSWKKVKFSALHPRLSKDKEMIGNVQKLEAAMSFAVASASDLKAAAKDLKAAAAIAKKTAANKSMSKSAAAASAEITKELTLLANAAASYNALKIYQTFIVNTKKQLAKQTQGYTKAVSDLDKLFKALAKDPSLESFKTLLKEIQKRFGVVQSATAGFSRTPGPKQADWQASSKAIKSIEHKIQGLMKMIKTSGVDKAAREKAFKNWALQSLKHIPTLKKVP
ncbi:MAG: hypothetical protein AAF393_01425 [Pseudomonadota bacterium]